MTLTKLFARLGLVLLACLAFASPASARPRIIFDTDIGGDADDLGALAMLMNLANKGEANLLAVMCWTIERHAVPAIDAVNRYYGRPQTLIGARKDGSWEAPWHYSRAVAEGLGSRRAAEDVPEATELYRRILMRQPDRSVTIVAVGPLMNILKLINSKPDAISRLSGSELIRRKVKQFVIMGGHFPEGKGEWNFNGDMPGVTRSVLSALTVPIIFSGYEVGFPIKTGRNLNRIDRLSPLYLGYRHFSEHAPWMKEGFRGEILDNASFDQTAVLYAIRGGVGTWWDRVSGGRVEVDANGDNRWIKGPVTNQSYLRLHTEPEKLAKVIEAIMLGNFNNPSKRAR